MCIHSRFYCQETFPAHLKDDMEMSGIDSAITETLVLRIIKIAVVFVTNLKTRNVLLTLKVSTASKVG